MGTETERTAGEEVHMRISAISGCSFNSTFYICTEAARSVHFLVVSLDSRLSACIHLLVLVSYLDSKVLGTKLPQLCVPVGSSAKECCFLAEPLRNKNCEEIIVRFLVNFCYCFTIPISKYIQHGLNLVFFFLNRL